jgi:hypothetical protein
MMKMKKIFNFILYSKQKAFQVRSTRPKYLRVLGSDRVG